MSGNVLTKPGQEEFLTTPNKKYLETVKRNSKPATERYDLPQTSSQEVGWFTKAEPGSNNKFSAVTITAFKQNQDINHPLIYSDITRYRDIFWRYNPPVPAAKARLKPNN